MTTTRRGAKGFGGVAVVFAVVAALLTSWDIASAKEGFSVEGMRKVDGEWQTISIGGTVYWRVDLGKLWYSDPADCEMWLEDANCGNTDHRIGANKWPAHLHVSRNDWPTASYEPDGVDSITQEEAENLWYVSIYLGGTWNSKPLAFTALGKDGSDSQIINSDADFHSNCHGFVLDKAGLSRFKLQLGDGGDGVQHVLEQYFAQVTHPEDGTAGTIMCATFHSNWVYFDTGNEGCMKVSSLAFKYRSSQTFTFGYNSPGRDNTKNFFGLAPTYWRKN